MTVSISLARDLKVAYSWINSSTQIVEHKEAFRTSNALDIVSKYDMVVDATDNAPSHYMINDCCIALGKQKSKCVVCGNPVKLSLRQYASKAVGRRHFFSNAVVWKGDAYAAADLIVSRARAMICSKILAIGKPCILVMDIVDCLFVAMFDSLNDKCKKKLEAIGRQYPFEPLKILRICHKEPPLMPRHKKEMSKRVIPTWQYKGPIIDQTKRDERFEEKEPEPLEQAIMKGENIIPTLETAATNSSQPA
ncbi:Adenylyltransferase and sulfurtransferase MOCS3 [Capsicum chinense]|nr:Adenylyltransferase and sulfurtransferase MOCS3 [Capsicum chinense]